MEETTRLLIGEITFCVFTRAQMELIDTLLEQGVNIEVVSSCVDEKCFGKTAGQLFAERFNGDIDQSASAPD